MDFSPFESGITIKPKYSLNVLQKKKKCCKKYKKGKRCGKCPKG